MKFSTNWLGELIPGLDRTAREVAALITEKTAEQEGVEDAAPWLDRVCVARVVSVAPIAGGHNVKAVVDTGSRYGTRTVVCGAPNCRAGMLTAYVPAGTQLGAGKRIEKAAMGGVESDGMLAAGVEIGLNRDHAGIVEIGGAAPGDPVPGCRPDHVIDIDNKSLNHRPDLWGHLGLAREVAAITGARLQDPVDLALLPAAGDPAIAVEIEDYALCPRYSALVFDNVTVGPSPLWLQYRLEAIGLNAINNIVDVTNYVMSELAQPMHAFDSETLAGDTIFVRLARAGESIQALNGETYELDGQAQVIADARGPVAIAGVIGGLPTGVTEATRRIVLESANFHPGHTRRTTARIRCRTDASMRFEKSQDPENTTRALARAVALLEAVSPGIRLVGGPVDARGAVKPLPVIALPLDFVRRKLGRAVEAEEVRAILASLEFGVEQEREGVLRVRVPSWRATKDVSIKDDLVEEVGRMLGYNSIAPAAPAVPAMPPPPSPEREFFHRVRMVAVEQGFTEVYNYSFVNEPQTRELGLDPAAHIRVTNPIASDQDLLRTTLLAGVVRNVRDNLRHFEAFRFFEVGYEIHKRAGSLPDERPHLAACIAAKAGDGAAGLFELKRLAECLAPGAEVEPAAAPRAFEHPRRAGEVRWRGETIGRLFELHPSLVECRAAVLDLDLAAMQHLAPAAVRYQSLRRFPSSAFDLSVVAGLRVPVGEIRRRITEAGGALLQSVSFVTQYVGKPLAEDRKSVSFRITVGAADRTLASEEIAAERARLIEVLQMAGFELRI